MFLSRSLYAIATQTRQRGSVVLVVLLVVMVLGVVVIVAVVGVKDIVVVVVAVVVKVVVAVRVVKVRVVGKNSELILFCYWPDVSRCCNNSAYVSWFVCVFFMVVPPPLLSSPLTCPQRRKSLSPWWPVLHNSVSCPLIE